MCVWYNKRPSYYPICHNVNHWWIVQMFLGAKWYKIFDFYAKKISISQKAFPICKILVAISKQCVWLVADKEYAKNKMLNYGLAKRFIKWFSHRVNVDQCEFAIVAMLLCAKLMYHNHILIWVLLQCFYIRALWPKSQKCQNLKWVS